MTIIKQEETPSVFEVSIHNKGEEWLKKADVSNFKPNGLIRAAFYVARKTGIDSLNEFIIKFLSEGLQLRLLLHAISGDAKKEIENLIRDGNNIKIKYSRMLHAKTLLFENEFEGRILVGSANLTQTAMNSDKELNGIITCSKDNTIYSNTVKWFDNLWKEGEDEPTIVSENDDLLNTICSQVKLFKYQRDALTNLHKFYEKPTKKGVAYNSLLTMPTGSGKTPVMACWISELLNKNKEINVVWTARQYELLVHAKNHLIKWGVPESEIHHIRSGEEFNAFCGTNPSNKHKYRVLLLTVQLMKNKEEYNTDILIYDEAHHLNPKNKKKTLLANETVHLLECIKYRNLIGMSATPFRMDTDEDKKFQDFFPAKDGLVKQEHHNRGYVYYIDLNDKSLVDYNNKPVLAKRKHESYETGFKINLIKKPYIVEFERRIKIGDFNDLDRNKIVVEKTLEWYKEQKNNNPNSSPRILVFACNTVHANVLGKLFIDHKSKYGNPVVQVFHTNAIPPGSSEKIDSGEDEKYEPFSLKKYGGNRIDVIQWFTKGEINILITVGLTTEGIDIPSLDCIAIARPTLSTKLYYQMVGRGMRGPAVGGKEKVYVLDFIDQIEYHGKKIKSIMGNKDIFNYSQIDKELEIDKSNEKGIKIFAKYNNKEYSATYFSREKIIYKGKEYTSPSAAGKIVTGREINGWTFWKYMDTKTKKECQLDVLRNKDKTDENHKKIKTRSNTKKGTKIFAKNDLIFWKYVIYNTNGKCCSVRYSLPKKIIYKGKNYALSLSLLAEAAQAVPKGKSTNDYYGLTSWIDPKTKEGHQIWWKVKKNGKKK
ncbi:MAG: DEAD/DEAH box helicase family protein [Bacteroidota bacterium]